ncbi:hypothetical protein [Reichenbachiella sp. MALMAid0571]|uniref:hypothetical protein n=1 Tax=Reichenbachiella sp. MALMAid0571 TaxID=3143939 RepID=UPI0032DF3E4D
MNDQRRKFLQQTAVVASGISILPSLSWAGNFKGKMNGRDEILKKLSVLNDDKVDGLLKQQVDKPGDRWNGGVMNNFELVNAHSTYGFIVTLASAYAYEFSEYYKSSALEQPLEKAITCLVNVQYDDGTIDLHSTNFHSTPDTAFLVNYLSPVYACIRRMKQPGLKCFVSQLEKFLINAGKCLVSGGIHTANHRWVVSSALARMNSFFPDPKYLKRIDQWLSEGIDLDADGQYTERSVSVYSAVCDNMFLTMGRLLDRSDLLDVARTNLAMTLYYIQPDGEVLTDASHRQDSAYVGFVNKYYYAYRYFAIKDKNPEFAAVCALIEEQMPEKITNFILTLLEDSIFENKLIEPSKVPDNYFKYFEHSGVFRIRRGSTDISVIEQNPTFFSYRKGNAVMQSMRLGAAFFGKGQFVAEEVEFDGKVIILKRTLTKGYYQPVPVDKHSGANAWKELSRDDRELSEAQTMTTVVTIKESDGKVSIESEITGCPNVPVTWEMSFRPGGEFDGVVKDKNTKDVFFLEKGNGQYQVGKDIINFGGGIVAHKWAEMRGMLPKQGGSSLYVTGYTPFNHTIELS